METSILSSPLTSLSTGDAVEQQGRLVWKTLGGTTEKPINDQFKSGDQIVWRKNEDRFRVADSDSYVVASVADGAGSSGMFCGAWAEALVEKLPQSPILDIDGLNGWMDGFWQDFSGEHKQKAQADAVKLNKFVREGSCSTLAACWLSREADDALRLHWLGYGDSPIYAFDHGEDGPTLINAFPETLGALESDPYLLNWKDLPKESHLKAGQMELKGPTTVVLASDGMGQFVLLRYLADLHFRQQAMGLASMAGSSVKLLGEFRQMLNSGSGKLAGLVKNHVETANDGFDTELGQLRAALKTETGFLEKVKDIFDKGLQPNDDSTLVMIDIHLDEPGDH